MNSKPTASQISRMIPVLGIALLFILVGVAHSAVEEMASLLPVGKERKTNPF